jgi:hypothetical protein
LGECQAWGYPLCHWSVWMFVWMSSLLADWSSNGDVKKLDCLLFDSRAGN